MEIPEQFLLCCGCVSENFSNRAMKCYKTVIWGKNYFILSRDGEGIESTFNRNRHLNIKMGEQEASSLNLRFFGSCKKRQNATGEENDS